MALYENDIPTLGVNDLLKNDAEVRQFCNGVVVYEHVDWLFWHRVFRTKNEIVLMCTGGTIDVNVDYRLVSITPGTIFVVPRHTVLEVVRHSSNVQCKGVMASANVVLHILRDKASLWNSAVLVYQLHSFTLTREEEEVVNLYADIITSKIDLEKKDDLTEESLRNLLLALAMELTEAVRRAIAPYKRSDSFSSDRIIMAKFMHMLGDYPRTCFQVQEYADRLNVTPRYLTEICSKYSTCSAHQWISRYVVRDVQSLLLYTSLSTNDIINRIGFFNRSSFGKFVKKHLGESPYAYRKNHMVP